MALLQGNKKKRTVYVYMILLIPEKHVYWCIKYYFSYVRQQSFTVIITGLT